LILACDRIVDNIPVTIPVYINEIVPVVKDLYLCFYEGAIAMEQIKDAVSVRIDEIAEGSDVLDVYGDIHLRDF
jgi:hypothetical protein